MFFLIVLLGVVGATAGTVGFQLQGVAPSTGGGLVSGATQRIGVGVLLASWLAALIAYFAGSYAAGRVARYDGVRNGVGVVLWTVLAALVLTILGAIFGSRFNVADQLHLAVSPGSLTLPGVVSLVVTYSSCSARRPSVGCSVTYITGVWIGTPQRQPPSAERTGNEVDASKEEGDEVHGNDQPCSQTFPDR